MSRLSVPSLQIGPEQAPEPIDQTELYLSNQRLSRSLWEGRTEPDSISFTSRSGLGLSGMADQGPSKLGAMFTDGNIIGLGYDRLSNWIDRKMSGDHDEDFTAHGVLKDLDAYKELTDQQRFFLNKSKNADDMLIRWRQVAEEKQRMQVLADMSMGESLFYGLVAGATDPLSYVPLIGQASKARVAMRGYRVANQSLKSGRSVFKTRMSLMAENARQGFWHSAIEGAVYETGFQSLRLGTQIETEDEGVLPTVAVTGAFSGVLGAGLRGGFSYRSSGRMARSAKTRLEGGQVEGLRRSADLRRTVLESAGLGWKTTRKERVGLDDAAVTGPGARLRLAARKEAADFREKSLESVKNMLVREGLVESEAEGYSKALELLEREDAFLNPLRDTQKGPRPEAEGPDALASLVRKRDVEEGGGFREADIEAGRTPLREKIIHQQAGDAPKVRGGKGQMPKGFGIRALVKDVLDRVPRLTFVDEMLAYADRTGVTHDGVLTVHPDDIAGYVDGMSPSKKAAFLKRLKRGGVNVGEDSVGTKTLVEEYGKTVDDLIEAALENKAKPVRNVMADVAANSDIDPQTRVNALIVKLFQDQSTGRKKPKQMSAYKVVDLPVGTTLKIQGKQFKIVEIDGVKHLQSSRYMTNKGTSLQGWARDYEIELSSVERIAADEGSLDTGAGRKIKKQISKLSKQIAEERAKPAEKRDLGLLSKLELQRENLRNGRDIDAKDPAAEVAKDMAELINRPPQQQTRTPATPDNMPKSKSDVSVESKLDSNPDGPSSNAFRKAKAAAINGMGRWSNVLKHALGRGMTSILIDASKNAPIKTLVSLRGLDDVFVEFYVTYNLSGKYPDKPAFYSPKHRTVFIDRASAKKMWDSNDRGIPVLGKPVETAVPSDVTTKLPKEVASSLEEFIDFLVMHEVVHATHHQNFDNFPPGLSRNMPKDKLNRVREAIVNDEVMEWKRNMQDAGPEEDPDVMFFSTDGPEPATNSVPHHGKGNPRSSVMTNLRANGWPKKAAQSFMKVLTYVSPVWRGALSPSPVMRDLQRYLINDPIYRWDTGPKAGSASSNRFIHHEGPRRRIHRIALDSWREVSSGLEKEDRITKEDFGARAQRARVNGGKDLVNDRYTQSVELFAKLSKEADDHTLSRGGMVGLEENMYMPDGESYYHRMYRRSEVRKESFIQMLVEKYGVSREEALEVQSSILSTGARPKNAIRRLIKDRGVIKTRGEIMKRVRYEDLEAFIETDLFKTQAHLGKTVGGEVEFRLAMAQFAEDHGIKDFVQYGVPRLDETGAQMMDDAGRPQTETKIAWEKLEDYLERAWKKMEQQDRYVANIDDVSAAYHKSFIEFDDFAKMHPEKASQYKGQIDEIVDTGLEHYQLQKHAAWSRKWFNDMAQIVQNTKDVPDDPDSFMSARLPAFIKNWSHMVMGGGLAISNVADFHRSIAEYGIKRTMGQEWTLWFRDLEAWTARNKVTREMGLGVEDLRADLQRNLRNALETGEAETGLEKFAASGASLMSKINGMAYVVNGHQKAFSSGVQSYLIDMIPKYVDGSLDARGVAKLKRLGIDMDSAKRINEAFNSGARKTSAKGNKYVEPWEGQGWSDFIMAVNRGVEINQSSPARAELWDFQTQGMSSLLFMYRNWAVASTNRVAASVLAGEKSHIAAGLLASVGLGALVTAVRASLNNEVNETFSDPNQFLRKSIDNGGFLGIAGEMHNIVSKMTDGALDALPGDSGNRYYNSATALSAIAGPVWAYPNFVTKTGKNLVTLDLDRYDIERTRNMAPFAGVHAIDGLFNNLDLLDLKNNGD